MVYMSFTIEQLYLNNLQPGNPNAGVWFSGTGGESFFSISKPSPRRLKTPG